MLFHFSRARDYATTGTAWQPVACALAGQEWGDYCFIVGLLETCRLAIQRRLLKFAGKSVSMLAALLYRIHRPVRRLDQALNVPCALRIQRNSDAGGQETALISDLIGLFD